MNKSENIQSNIAERVAFTVTGDADERMKIKKTVISAYGMRSDAVHHGEGKQKQETVIEFLFIVHRFFLIMIRDNAKYEKRQEFFDAIERAKFTSPSPAT